MRLKFEFSCGAGVTVMGHWTTLTERGLYRSHCFWADSVREAQLVCDRDIGDGEGHRWHGPYDVSGRSWGRHTKSDHKRGGRGGKAILELIGTRDHEGMEAVGE